MVHPLAAEAAQLRAAGRRGPLVSARYRVLDLLGRGGAAEVFRVRDEREGRVLALKRLMAHEGLKRRALHFRREFHTLARLRHPHIVEVYDYGVDGVPYYTMELLDGDDLSRRVGREGPVDAQTTARVLRDVAAALTFLHRRRLVHRDVSPRNVRCTPDGQAKLIDFGLLASVGAYGDVAGTPPCVAPEQLRRLPVDQRADLYGLGALAYYLLVGQHAYPARQLCDLEVLWRNHPEPPSQLRPDVPAALEQLVLSLLSQDPLGRPASADEVVDRLAALDTYVPRSNTANVASAAGQIDAGVLVGRGVELAQLRRGLDTVMQRPAAMQAVLIDAPVGMGKSRLLREFALEAQLNGALTVQVTASNVVGAPYGVLRDVARELLAILPHQARLYARRHGPTLLRVLPELVDSRGLEHETTNPDLAGARVKLQRALGEWLAALSAHRPVVILLDDFQHCDEASASLLAALVQGAGHEGRLMLVTALCTDETARAPDAVEALRARARRLTPRLLGEAEIVELLTGTFGVLPRLSHLASWLRQVSAGVPLHCIELLHHLVAQKVLVCVEGSWQLVDDRLREAALPQELQCALEARILALPEIAQTLATALAVQQSELSLELAQALGREIGIADEVALFSALDLLLEAQMLVAPQSGQLRFRHLGFQRLLYARMDASLRQRLHRRAGLVLAAAAGDQGCAEAGWHFLAGEDLELAARHLERAGRRLVASQSFADAIAPLEAALAVALRKPASRHTIELQTLLVRAGGIADRDVVLRCSPPLLEILERLSGVRLAKRLRPVLGRHVGLVVAVLAAMLWWVVALRFRRLPSPYTAICRLVPMATYVAAVHGANFDEAAVARVRRELLEPIAIHPRRREYSAYLMCSGLELLLRGQWQTVRSHMLRFLELDARCTTWLVHPFDRLTGVCAARYLLASMAVRDHDDRCLDQFSWLARSGHTFFMLSAQLGQVMYRRMRGEEHAARQLLQALEVQHLQLGSSWLLEAQLQWMSSLAFALTGDVLALKQVLTTVERLTERGYALTPFAELARGEYQRLRGDAAEARRTLEQLLLVAPPLLEQPLCCALGETLLALGEDQLAWRYALRARTAAESESGLAPYRVRSACLLARLQCRRGQRAEARQLLDREIAYLEQRSSSPLLHGLLHEAALEVTEDSRHGEAACTAFRRTHNPTLLARACAIEIECRERPSLRARLRKTA